MTEYKCIAECMRDILAFLSKCDDYITEYTISPGQIEVSGVMMNVDCEFVFTTKLSVDAIKKIMRRIPDLHAMERTLLPSKAPKRIGVYPENRNSTHKT